MFVFICLVIHVTSQLDLNFLNWSTSVFIRTFQRETIWRKHLSTLNPVFEFWHNKAVFFLFQLFGSFKNFYSDQIIWDLKKSVYILKGNLPNVLHQIQKFWLQCLFVCQRLILNYVDNYENIKVYFVFIDIAWNFLEIFPCIYLWIWFLIIDTNFILILYMFKLCNQ